MFILNMVQVGSIYQTSIINNIKTIYSVESDIEWLKT